METCEQTAPALGTYASRMCDWAVKSTNNLNDSEDVNIETFVGAIPMCHPVTCGFPASLWIDEKLTGRFSNISRTILKMSNGKILS